MPTATKTPVSAKRSATARENGAKSNGPKTTEGKAKSSQNALKHGLTAAKFLALPQDEADAYEKFFDYMLDDLAPEGAEQEFYAARMIETMWRLRRIPSLEARFADPDPKARRHPVGPQLHGGWLQHFGELARYESSLERTLDKNRKALRQLQNEPKPSSCDPRHEERRRKGPALSEAERVGMEVQMLNKQAEDRAPEPRAQEPFQNEPKPTRAPEPRASEPRAQSSIVNSKSSMSDDPLDLRTIDLKTFNRRKLPLSQQRTLELVDFWLTNHPGGTQEEALQAVDPFHYRKSQNEPNLTRNAAGAGQ